MPDFDILNTAKEFTLQIIGVGALFFLIEKIRPLHKNIKFLKDDSVQELGMATLNAIAFIPLWTILVSLTLISLLSGLMPYQAFNEHITALPIPLQVLIGAFIIDFSTYWRHRFTHNYMWPFHAVHHAARELNWLTNLRLHPIDILTAVILDTTILYLLGFSGPGIIWAQILILFYGYFTHSNINLQYDKPLCYIFASPHFHRWHHANEKSAYDKNFCSMFSCLDLIFGTYHHPETPPEKYGISKAEQKDFPALSLWGQLLYPFKRILKK